MIANRLYYTFIEQKLSKTIINIKKKNLYSDICT